MRNLLRVLLLTGCIFPSCASHPVDDYRQEIQGVLDTYFQANVEKDYGKILDMIYPRLFDIVTREEMFQLFNQMEAEGIDYVVRGAETTSISNRVVYNAEQYALVKYTLDIGIRFQAEEYDKPEVTGAMLGAFQNQYGKDRVNFETATKTFWIKADNVMYAIAPQDSKEWRFMEKKPGMEQFVSDFIPQEVQDKLK